VPAEAVTLFSHAQVFEDQGRKEKAEELYRQIVKDYPQMVQAQEALRQITSG